MPSVDHTCPQGLQDVLKLIDVIKDNVPVGGEPGELADVLGVLLGQLLQVVAEDLLLPRDVANDISDGSLVGHQSREGSCYLVSDLLVQLHLFGHHLISRDSGHEVKDIS